MTREEAIRELNTFKIVAKSELGETALDMAIKALEQQYLNPEADREESKAYCSECDHIEMCSWYPHYGCEWLKTD